MIAAGTVVDLHDDAPIPGASIILVDKNGKQLSGTKSDSKGGFVVNYSNYDDKIVFSHVGYHTNTMGAASSVGDVVLSRTGGTVLDEVVVIGKRAMKRDNIILFAVLMLLITISKKLFA